MNKTERSLIDSKLLKTFVEIADCGNLTLAASRLNRTQSAISVQIRKLETELETTLFVRDVKGMTLSANGKKLLPSARRILSELAHVQIMFERPLNGKIKVGIPDDFDEGVLEKSLVDFSRSHPGVEVLATSGCTAAFPDAIQKGELDIAVYSGPDNVTGEPILEQRPVWVASKTLHLQPSEPVPLAVINHGCWMGKLPGRALEEQGRSYNIAFECGGLMSLKAAIRAGFAVGIVYESTVEAGMKVLTTKNGFPILPMSKRSVIIGDDAPQDLAQAMVAAIKRAV
ncbi:MAG: LysR family transcriptional regulator [Methyloligellaceae bacterium]